MSKLRFLTHIVRNAHFSVHQPICLRSAAVATFNNNNNNACTLIGYDGTRRKWNSLTTPLCSSYAPKLFTLKSALSNGSQKNFNRKTPDRTGKTEADRATVTDAELFGEASHLSIFGKFKLMYKKYGYILIPVHLVTSACWFGGFYYMSKSGVDVAALLQYINLSESIIEKVKNSDMGHLAVAYLCYKLATPLRYAVTLGGTTFSIKYLVQSGHIKPMPSKSELMQIYEDKKAVYHAAKAEKEAEKQAEKLRQDKERKDNETKK